MTDNRSAANNSYVAAAQPYGKVTKKTWQITPVLAPVLKSRKLTVLISFVALMQIGLTGVGLQVWVCPIQASLGMPCPGCGLSRAMTALISGHWHLAMMTHPFAPGILVAILLLLVISLLPDGIRGRTIRTLDAIERRTGFIICILIGWGVHWSLRIIESIPY